MGASWNLTWNFSHFYADFGEMWSVSFKFMHFLIFWGKSPWIQLPGHDSSVDGMEYQHHTLLDMCIMDDQGLAHFWPSVRI